MTAGLQVFDAQGNLLINSDTVTGRLVAFIAAPAPLSGTISVPSWGQKFLHITLFRNGVRLQKTGWGSFENLYSAAYTVSGTTLTYTISIRSDVTVSILAGVY